MRDDQAQPVAFCRAYDSVHGSNDCLTHLADLVWAGFYRWRCLPTSESSFYFSATSYSTVGYGDIVLPQVWRTSGPVESVIGVIMCDISVSGLFAIAIRLIESEARFSTTARRQRLPAPAPEMD